MERMGVVRIDVDGSASSGAHHPAAIGVAHGRHHDSHHCCSHSATWRRRLLRPWTLVRQAISLTNFASRYLLVGLATGQTTEVAGPSKKNGAPIARHFYWTLRCDPIWRRLVIIVDAAVIVAVPVPTGALAVLRRLFELVLGKVGPISAEICIVLQERPRRGVVIFAHSEKAAEAENGIRNLAAGLVEHDTFDLSDLFLVAAINGSSFNLIAAYQSGRLSRIKSICCCHGVPFLGLARGAS